MHEEVEYDEGTVLRCYYANNRRHFMTSNETEALRLSWLRLAADDNQECADELSRALSLVSEEVRRDSLKSPDELYDEVDRRLLCEYAIGQLEILRCPECDRIVRTPLAKQCLWCGHDWHKTRPDRLQFSLRSLFILTTVIGVVGAPFFRQPGGTLGLIIIVGCLVTPMFVTYLVQKWLGRLDAGR